MSHARDRPILNKNFELYSATDEATKFMVKTSYLEYFKLGLSFEDIIRVEKIWYKEKTYPRMEDSKKTEKGEINTQDSSVEPKSNDTGITITSVALKPDSHSQQDTENRLAQETNKLTTSLEGLSNDPNATPKENINTNSMKKVDSSIFTKLVANENNQTVLGHYKHNFSKLVGHSNATLLKIKNDFQKGIKKHLKDAARMTTFSISTGYANSSSSNIGVSEKLLPVKPINYSGELFKTNNSKFAYIITYNHGLTILHNHLKRHFPPNSPFLTGLNASLSILHSYNQELYQFFKKTKLDEKTNTIKSVNIDLAGTKSPSSSSSQSTNVLVNKFSSELSNNLKQEFSSTHPRELQKTLYFKNVMANGYYYIISRSSRISFYTPSGSRIGKTFDIDMVKCAALKIYPKTDGNDERFAFFIGTAYGMLYIFDEDKISNVLYFGDSILKIKIVDHRYLVLTASSLKVLTFDKKKDILIDNFKFDNEVIFDGDIYVDSLAVITKKKISPDDYYLKIWDISHVKEAATIEYGNETCPRSLVILDNSERPKTGNRFKLPKPLFCDTSHGEIFNLRFYMGIFPIDLIHFTGIYQYEAVNKDGNSSSLLAQDYYKIKSVNSIISIVDFEGNNVIYSSIPV